jgi:hypothetical protein
VIALLLPGCGMGGGGGGNDQTAEAPPPVAKPEDFPKATGQTLAQLTQRYGPGGPRLTPSVSDLQPGQNRFGFGLFDRTAGGQIADAPVALYVAPAAGGPARGPYLARTESLNVKPRFRSRTVSEDPNAARNLYVARVPFPKAGLYRVMGLERLDTRLVVASPSGPQACGSTLACVIRRSRVPDVGDKVPSMHTPTTADVGGVARKIDTRRPPDSMHEVDFADVVGRKPVILVFSTPGLCRGVLRVCGAVVDIAEQVKAEHPGAAAFIHMEIYNDNRVDHGFRPQVLRWHLPTEPWVFAINRRGRIVARIEGAFSVSELERALAASTGR